MYCNKCGREIATGARFCKFCGSPARRNVAETGELAPESDRVIRDKRQGGSPAGDYALSRQDAVLIVSMLALSVLMILIFALTL